MRLALAFLCLVMFALPGTSALADSKLDALLAAYPQWLASYSDEELVWKDGTHAVWPSAQVPL